MKNKQNLTFYAIIKIMNYGDYIWDLGGTLLDNYQISTQAFLATLERFERTAEFQAVPLRCRPVRPLPCLRLI